MIVLNLKSYTETYQKSLLFADIANEIAGNSGVRIVLCPPAPYLLGCTERFADVFAQHTDATPAGAYTGAISAELLKRFNVKGSLVNHSEKKIAPDAIKPTIDNLHMHGLESLLCAATTKEATMIAHYAPTFIAVEPPELIGSGVSVSKARPEIVINSVKAIKEINKKVTVLCGAGVSNRQDVAKALELGAEGVLLASAFVKAKDPKEFLIDLAAVF